MTFHAGQVSPTTRLPHRHDPIRDTACRAQTLVELRRAYVAALALEAGLELGGEQLVAELRLVTIVLDRLNRRIHTLEELARGD